MGSEKVEERLPAHVADPGKLWRRAARIGAGLCFIATILPVNSLRENFWSQFGMILEIALTDQTDMLDGPVSWLGLIFCCFVPVIFFGGPIALVVCGKNVLQPGRQRLWQKLPLLFLWLGTFLLPFMFFLLKLNDFYNQDLVAVFIGSLLAYLLVGGLTFLGNRRDYHKPTQIFWIGLVPSIVMALAWSCLLAYGLLIGTAMAMLLFVCVFGAVGGLLLCVGWLKWWRAVARYERDEQIENG